MKLVFIIIAVLAVIGYTWYADILPFDFTNNPAGLSSTVENIREISNVITSSGLSPTAENLQQISNAIPSNENKIVYYSFEDIPSLPDKQIPVNALKKAIEMWESNNPNLEFIQSKNANMEIRWQVYASPTHIGLATCNSVLFGILSHCILDISVGDDDCNGDFIQNNENMVTNILMHEIGHALGLGHTSETGHLMYSTESPQITFDSKGYVVPDRFEELYVGQKALLQQEKEIRTELGSLDVKISREQSQYDEYYKQYEYYNGKTLSPSEYQKTQKIFSKVNSEADKLNTMIDQQNQLIEKINEILNQLGCKPNFEINS